MEAAGEVGEGLTYYGLASRFSHDANLEGENKKAPTEPPLQLPGAAGEVQ